MPTQNTDDLISELYHLLLWAPFVRRNIDAMSEDRRAHVRGLADASQASRAKSIERIFEDECYVDCSNDVDIFRTNFERQVSDSAINPFYITGYSGTGKSTYINVTLERICAKLSKDKNAKKILLDIAREDLSVSPEISINWLQWQNNNGKIYLVINSLLREINKYLFKVSDENEAAFKIRLQRMDENFCRLFFRKRKEFNNLFLIMKDHYDNKFDYTYDPNDRINADDNEKHSYKYRMSERLWDECGSNQNFSPAQIAELLLRLLVTLITCENYNENKDFRVFITLDNVERFVGELELYDADLVDIALVFSQFPGIMDRAWREIQDLVGIAGAPFSRHFALIIVMREATNAMLSEITGAHNVDNIEGKVTITDWFDSGKIIDKKFTFIRKYFAKILPELFIYIDKNKLNKLIVEIFADRSPDVGLYTIVQTMYSYSKRRIINNLLASFCNCQVAIDTYLSFAEVCTKLGRSNFSVYGIYRNAARQTVLRTLINPIVDSGYFETIGEVDSSNSLTRRVLTFLYNDSGSGMSFRELIDGIFKSPTDATTSTPSDIETLAEVINIMRARRIGNYWCPLILLTFNDPQNKYAQFNDAFGNPTVNSIKSMLETVRSSQVSGYEDKLDNFCIKISVAGRTFIRSIIPTFEYFAARYLPERERNEKTKPLFTYFAKFPTSKLELENWADEVYFYIQIVANKTLGRVDAVANRDKEFVWTPGTNVYKYNLLYNNKYLYNNQTHTQRIIDSHIRYIDNFRRLLIIKAKETRLLDSPELSSLVESLSVDILSVITQYVDKIKYLSEVYISGEPNTPPSSKHYYLGGPSRAAQADISGERYYSQFLNKLNEAKESPLNEDIAIEKSN